MLRRWTDHGRAPLCFHVMRFKLRYWAGWVKVWGHFDMWWFCAVYHCFEMSNLSDKGNTGDQENNNCGWENNYDDDLHPVVLEIFVDAALVLTASVLSDHSTGLSSLLTQFEAGLTGAGLMIVLEPCVTRVGALADAGAGGGVPHLPWSLSTLPPGLLVPAAALTGLSAPHMSLFLGLTSLLLHFATATLTLHLVLHLECGALLVTLAASHRALAHHDGDLPGPCGLGNTACSGVTASTASLDNNMAGTQLVNVSVVRPRNWNHLQHDKWFRTNSQYNIFSLQNIVGKVELHLQDF